MDYGLEQLDGYLDGRGLSSGWLVLFHRRSGLPPISQRTTSTMAECSSGRTITVVRG